MRQNQHPRDRRENRRVSEGHQFQPPSIPEPQHPQRQRKLLTETVKERERYCYETQRQHNDSRMKRRRDYEQATVYGPDAHMPTTERDCFADHGIEEHHEMNKIQKQDLAHEEEREEDAIEDAGCYTWENCDDRELAATMFARERSHLTQGTWYGPYGHQRSFRGFKAYRFPTPSKNGRLQTVPTPDSVRQEFEAVENVGNTNDEPEHDSNRACTP